MYECVIVSKFKNKFSFKRANEEENTEETFYTQKQIIPGTFHVCLHHTRN